jgi:hypothetical protein
VGGPGPDFRDAIIAAPWGLLRGDVELHVRASDFHRHGHGQDATYNGLALHVVFWDDEGEDTLLAGGRRAPVATLVPQTETGVEDVRHWLSGPALWQEPCRSALERLGSETVAATLDSLGQQRFREKAEAMRQLLEKEPADEVIWQGLLRALGYGGDRQSFTTLAARVPWKRISATLRRLPSEQRATEARRLLAASSPAVARGQFRQGRPGNAGWRRLEGAALLAARFCCEGLASRLEKILSDTPEQGASTLLASLQVAGCPQAFIGRSRALEIVTNVVLPYAAAGGDAALARKAEAVYERLPRPAAYGAVRHLDRAVGQGVRVDARRQQGMLRLLRQQCTQGGCGRCPLS